MLSQLTASTTSMKRVHVNSPLAQASCYLANIFPLNPTGQHPASHK